MPWFTNRGPNYRQSLLTGGPKFRHGLCTFRRALIWKLGGLNMPHSLLKWAYVTVLAWSQIW